LCVELNDDDDELFEVSLATHNISEVMHASKLAHLHIFEFWVGSSSIEVEEEGKDI
jgi:hypothetical protein